MSGVGRRLVVLEALVSVLLDELLGLLGRLRCRGLVRRERRRGLVNRRDWPGLLDGAVVLRLAGVLGLVLGVHRAYSAGAARARVPEPVRARSRGG
jgi:hypothetical protein